MAEAGIEPAVGSRAIPLSLEEQEMMLKTPKCGMLVALTLIACSGSGSDQLGVLVDAEFPILTTVELARTDSSVSFVEVTDVAVDSSGRVYVGDFYRGSVHVFSPDGRLLRIVGSRGSGPGQFRQLRNVQVIGGDSLVVYDSGKGDLTTFAPDSSNVVAVKKAGQHTGALPREVTVTESGGTGYFAVFEEWDPVARIVNERLAFLDRAGVVIHASLLFGPKHPIVRVEVGGTQYRTPHPFRTGLMIAVHHSGLYATIEDNNSGVISVRSVTDPREREYAVPHKPPQVTAADRETFVGTIPLEWARPAVRADLRDYKGHWPTTDRLLFDADSRLWVRLGDRPSQQRLWIVLNSQTAAPMYGVVTPADAVVLEGYGPIVYAAREDEQGHRYVSTLSLSPSADQ